MVILKKLFFNRDAQLFAQELLGKIICVRHEAMWLYAQITETEAYYIDDKASHASLGFTEKRKALFMPAGTIYMYHSRGGASFNVSTAGEGNAVLIKSATVYGDDEHMIKVMQLLNPLPNTRIRPVKTLCAGQALLCRSLGLTIADWDQKQFCKNQFYIKDVGDVPRDIIRAKRRGIPEGRDEPLLYRIVMVV